VDADTAATPAGGTDQVPPAWPRIADYWPDPAAAPARPQRQPPPLLPPAPAKRWAKPVIGTAVAVLLVAGAAITGHRLLTRPADAPAGPAAVAAPTAVPSTDPATGPAIVLPEPSPSSSSFAPRPKAPPPPPTSAAAKKPPAAGSFELASNLTELSIGTARLASGIARVSTPAGSSAVPKLAVSGGTAELTVTEKGDGATKVAVVLDDRVVWTIRIGGGSRLTRIDLSGAGVARIDLIGGAREIDLTLPRLRQVLPIRMSGGVHTWRITTADRVPVRLIARDGAGGVELYGDDQGGLDKGERVGTSGGTDDGELDLDAVAGIGALTVDQR
jgi:hypothetical protein